MKEFGRMQDNQGLQKGTGKIAIREEKESKLVP
jgi:hypothetical protein